MTIDGVEVAVEGFVPFKDELKNYVTYAKERIPGVAKIKVKMCKDGFVDVEYTAYGQKFERIRRITGYLVGTTDRWNDSKQEEERDLVKHL